MRRLALLAVLVVLLLGAAPAPRQPLNFDCHQHTFKWQLKCEARNAFPFEAEWEVFTIHGNRNGSYVAIERDHTTGLVAFLNRTSNLDIYAVRLSVTDQHHTVTVVKYFDPLGKPLRSLWQENPLPRKLPQKPSSKR